MRKVLLNKLYDGIDSLIISDIGNNSFWNAARSQYSIEPWLSDTDKNIAIGFIFHDDKKYVLFLLNN